jgi:hypothetical protein
VNPREHDRVPAERRKQDIERLSSQSQKNSSQNLTVGIERAEIHKIAEEVARDVIRDYFDREIKPLLAPLLEKLERQSELNGRLAAQLSDLQRTLAAQANTLTAPKPHPAASLPDEGSETFEIAWSDRGGVRTPFAVPDNPFSAKNPHRR